VRGEDDEEGGLKMPYSTPPAYVDGLPKDVQNAWMKAWNNAYSYAKKHGMDDPEGYAFSVANSVANKRGYTRKDGKWIKQSADHDNTIPETLSLDTPDYQVMGATTWQLVTFHSRLHKMLKNNEDEDGRVAKMHSLVSDLLKMRGVSVGDN